MRMPTDTAAATIVADVMHVDVPTLPPTATVADARAWFAGGASRRLALVADGERYVGSLTRADVEGTSGADRPVGELARHGRTVRPGETAASGRDQALATGARRVPVVDRDGRLRGVLAVTTDERFFSCREDDA